MLKFFFACLCLNLSISTLAQQLWSDPATWGGQKPVAGEEVTIPLGTSVLLDESPPALAGLRILGSLEFDRKDLTLSSDWILVSGSLIVGSEASPFEQKANLILTGSDTEEDIMNMGTRGLMVMNGQLELHGATPDVLWTKLNANASVQSTVLTLAQEVEWAVGDEIIVGPTDYYEAANGNSVTQRLRIAETDGLHVTTNQGISAQRWGVLQYPTANGMSLDSTDVVSPPTPDTDSTTTPLVLDERAPVGYLTRTIVIQAPDDQLWQQENFGVHIMIMGLNGSAKFDGVEIRRGGQLGRLRRYPVHWHMLSYNGSETWADATGQYMKNSVINQSRNRGIVIHGTNGLDITNNIVFDIRGHGIFTEDAVERRNNIDHNLVLHVRNPNIPAQLALKQHEIGERGSSGFWISNPDNVVTNNHAGDCQTNGFWLAFPRNPWGDSQAVIDSTHGGILNPSRIRFGVFDNNTAHSNGKEGIMLDNVEIDTLGNTFPHQYTSTTDGQDITWPFTTLRRFTLSRYKTWKNGSNGIWDRAVWATNYEMVSADNCERFFAGSGADGLIERGLVVGTSLNHLMNGTDRPDYGGENGYTETPAAFATYHSAFTIKDNIVVNFPAVEGVRSGAFATEDYYIRPVDKGHKRNTNNLLIQSHPGVKLWSLFDYFSLAGALWDPNGNWGEPDSNAYFVYDVPFLTYGQTPTVVNPDEAVSGGVLVNGPFYGFNAFVVNEANIEWEDLMALDVKRYNAEKEEVGSWEVDEAGATTWALGHMRHFAAHADGHFVLKFPSIKEVHDVAMTVENMLDASHTLLLAVEYSGAYEISQVFTSTGNYLEDGHKEWPTSYAHKHVYSAVDNYEAVLNSSGETYWHDACNGVVWIKLQGGIEQQWEEDDYGEFDDEKLYRSFKLRVWGSPSTSTPSLPETSIQVNGNTLESNHQSHFSSFQWLNCTNNYTPIQGQNQHTFVPESNGSYALLIEEGTCRDTTSCLDVFDVGLLAYEHAQNIQITPNPSSGIIHLETKLPLSNATIRCVDTQGKILVEHKGVDGSGFNLDLTWLQNGFYFFEIQTKEQTFVRRWVKKGS